MTKAKINEAGATSAPSRAEIQLTKVRNIIATTSRFSPAFATRLVQFLYFFPQKLSKRVSRMRGVPPAKLLLLKIKSGKSIKFYEWGSGPSVLLMHGWGGCGGQWQAFVNPLVERGYKVITFDAPAHGESSGFTTDTLEMSMAVEAIHQHLGPLHALITHSFGGVVGLYAAKQGVQFDALVCIATPDPTKLFAKFIYMLKIPAVVARLLKSRLETRYARLGIDIWKDFALDKLRKGYSGPLLHIYDNRDEEVSPSENRDVSTALCPTDSLMTDGLGHYRVMASPQVVTQVLTFLADCQSRGSVQKKA
jgi:pimeloyl-ACP methyl ester carboxylesterase